MKIKDKRGFAVAIISSILLIVTTIGYMIYKEPRLIISTLLLLAFASINFKRAFSKKGLLEELNEYADERDLYLTTQSSHLLVEIMNYGLCAGTFVFAVMYGITKNIIYMSISATMCGILVMMFIGYLLINIYLEKRH